MGPAGDQPLTRRQHLRYRGYIARLAPILRIAYAVLSFPFSKRLLAAFAAMGTGTNAAAALLSLHILLEGRSQLVTRRDSYIMPAKYSTTTSPMTAIAAPT